MELKEYQIKTLDQVKRYLELVAKERSGGNAKHASMDAWQSFGLQGYKEKKNGLGEDLPNFCLKIPTGGGKTFLAVKTIDLINTIYVKSRTGLIIWIVPSTQIYNQTLKALRDREHVYRQHLDIASGGRTLIKEKTDYFSPQDVKENWVVLMLMLPSAWRENRETLRMFKDNGGFQEFFPSEDRIDDHQKLFELFPNLETFGDGNGFWKRQIKTSLGNVLRVLKPVIILDEGHKAYGEKSQDVLCSFNPSIIVELSATPLEASNILVNISGIELNREGMIKLDLHVVNKTSPQWKDTLLAAVTHRDKLEQTARKFKANAGRYIRPICLIQVERTGIEQRDGRRIHAEDVKEWLVQTQGIPVEQVAIKTSVKDELKEIDDHGGLLSPDCSIRYIITKQALQEGWDCSFAYVLCILNNSRNENALTQLVGRILRQPYAKKTKVSALDESYVFTYNQATNDVLENIKKGFKAEGLGDLQTSVLAESDENDDDDQRKIKESSARSAFKNAARHIVLPIFLINENKNWRPVEYEADIASRIPWDKITARAVLTLTLSDFVESNFEVSVNLSDDQRELIRARHQLRKNDARIEEKIDSVFMCRHLMDAVPNPWVAYELGTEAITILRKRYPLEIITHHLVFIIEELKKSIVEQKELLAKALFMDLLKNGTMRFMVITKELGFQLPTKIPVKPTATTLNKRDGSSLQRSLFNFVPADGFNETERAVAWYLEDQHRMFFWYRNISRHDYAIQGWRKHKIYPDFIFTTTGLKNSFDRIFVVETKGVHLVANEDTQYKKTIFDICNEKAKETDLEKLHLKFKNKPIKFEVVFGDEWKARLNEMVFEK